VAWETASRGDASACSCRFFIRLRSVIQMLSTISAMPISSSGEDPSKTVSSSE